MGLITENIEMILTAAVGLWWASDRLPVGKAVAALKAKVMAEKSDTPADPEVMDLDKEIECWHCMLGILKKRNLMEVSTDTLADWREAIMKEAMSIPDED